MIDCGICSKIFLVHVACSADCEAACQRCMVLRCILNASVPSLTVGMTDGGGTDEYGNCNDNDRNDCCTQAVCTGGIRCNCVHVAEQCVIREGELAESVDLIGNETCDCNAELTEQEACDQRCHGAARDRADTDRQG